VSGPVLANRIRELRQLQPGLTQEELARRCHVTRQTIIALEAGRYLPSLELAFRLARALAAGVEDVFQWADDSDR
jgi:putative transcriptional regulator